MSLFLADFLSASLIMGLGIGIDAAIATGARAKFMERRSHILGWIIGVSLTHTIFPMFGYLTSYFSLKFLPEITPIIGLIAFLLIAHFVKDELNSLREPNDSSVNERSVLVSLGIILAVSWDALWSGPAKSAQVVGWPEFAVWASFILVGLIVAALTIISLVLARYVKNIQSNQWYFAQKYSQWLQLSVISYFGWLALTRYSLSIYIPWFMLLLISFVVMAGLIYIYTPKTHSTIANLDKA